MLCKKLLKLLLLRVQIPVIPCRLVSRRGFHPSDARAASWPELLTLLEHARPLGLVLKPCNGMQGSDVFRVRSVRELELAWRALPLDDCVASKFFPFVTEIRVFVCYGRVCHAFYKLPPRVVGDGSSTVAQLALPRAWLGQQAGTPSEPDMEQAETLALCETLWREGARVLTAGEELVLDWQHNLCRGAR